MSSHHPFFPVLLKVGLVALSLASGSNAGPSFFRKAASLGYQNRNVCPARCTDTGPSPGNWSLYHNFDQIASCDQTMFYDFTLEDNVDDLSTLHRIYACTSFGPDWTIQPANTSGNAVSPSSTTANVTYEIGTWPDVSGTIFTSSLVTQLRHYLTNGFAPVDRPTLLFASAGAKDALSSPTLNNTSSLAMQYCKTGSTADHIFGLIATGNGTFGAVQSAPTSWSKAECLTLLTVNNVSGPAMFTTTVFLSTNATNNAATSNSTLGRINSTTVLTPRWSDKTPLLPRGECKTTQVVSGDGCGSLAQKCGITGDQFTKYNPGTDFCAKLQPYQHVCCSEGTMPDFAPKTNSDGSCATYTVTNGDNCAKISAQYSLTIDKLSSFNTKTWAWNGCDSKSLWVGTVICVSSGNPPMPASVSSAVCGPQKPNTKQPPAGTNISSLNPCPLNACCDVWGQVSTLRKPPLISGLTVLLVWYHCRILYRHRSPPSTYRSVAFYEGFNLDRPCLYQSASQIDTKAYTHVFYSFGTLDTNFKVQIGNDLSQYEFQEFQRLSAKKILSIGGWSFSTDPSTYMIFRNSVATAANRQTAAKNIADFINANGLDGVNIDWEYPGVSEIQASSVLLGGERSGRVCMKSAFIRLRPSLLLSEVPIRWESEALHTTFSLVSFPKSYPRASIDEGENYLAFLAVLRNLLPSKELSVAAPASYWYLKGFPISDMSKILDYVIYMTYDLHGQWDANNQWSQIGCTSGQCLRSDVNLTETIGSLAMAGVPSNKVIVGVTSYGRSFAMAEAGCYGPQCKYLGSASDSKATAGECTQTAGYISNAEIQKIIADPKRVNQNFVDNDSHSNILVYDNTQWVGWMDDSIKADRSAIYKGIAMGGTADWATDLQKYNDPPAHAGSWMNYRNNIKLHIDPVEVGERNGNWSQLNCDDPAVTDIRTLTPQQRWAKADCGDAFSDIMKVWQTDKGKRSFSESVSDTIHGPESADCGGILDQNCGHTIQCTKGPAQYLIWDSFVAINQIYTNYHNALVSAAALQIDNSLAKFENTFAPVPPPKSDKDAQIIIALLTLGASAVAAPFFNTIAKELPYFVDTLGKVKDSLGIYKDLTSAFITFGSNIAKAMVDPGQAMFGWDEAASRTLAALFDGSDASITTLTGISSTGSIDVAKAAKESIPEFSKNIERTFYGFAIPAVWQAAGVGAFILDASITCDQTAVLGDYITGDTAGASKYCYNSRLYYLVHTPGDWQQCGGSARGNCNDKTNKFEPPAGLDSLDGANWGGIKLGDLIAGSVKTYAKNDNKNGGPIADAVDPTTLDDLANKKDITTPGFIRLPLCSPDMAQQAWRYPDRVDKTDPLYPCVPLRGKNTCYHYTYEDQTTKDSPSVSDCQAIVDIIRGGADWTTGEGGHRTLADHGSCKFGVKNAKAGASATYYTQSQDVINIITEAISQFNSSGHIGAKGTMQCSGSGAGKDHINWDISS
nr:killer toxin subunits alpha/beta [Quercus suber]